MDELFSMNLWAWQFSKAETTGVGRQIADLESGKRRLDTDKGRQEEAEAQSVRCNQMLPRAWLIWEQVQGEEKPVEARDEYARTQY